MADLSAWILRHLVLKEARAVAVVAVVVVSVVDEVADVDVAVSAVDEVADVEVPEVVVVEGKLQRLDHKSRTDLTSTNRGGFGDFQGKKQTFE